MKHIKLFEEYPNSNSENLLQQAKLIISSKGGIILGSSFELYTQGEGKVNLTLVSKAPTLKEAILLTCYWIKEWGISVPDTRNGWLSRNEIDLTISDFDDVVDVRKKIRRIEELYIEAPQMAENSLEQFFGEFFEEYNTTDVMNSCDCIIEDSKGSDMSDGDLFISFFVTPKGENKVVPENLISMLQKYGNSNGRIQSII